MNHCDVQILLSNLLLWIKLVEKSTRNLSHAKKQTIISRKCKNNSRLLPLQWHGDIMRNHLIRILHNKTCFQFLLFPADYFMAQAMLITSILFVYLSACLVALQWNMFVNSNLAPWQYLLLIIIFRLQAQRSRFWGQLETNGWHEDLCHV